MNKAVLKMKLKCDLKKLGGVPYDSERY